MLAKPDTSFLKKRWKSIVFVLLTSVGLVYFFKQYESDTAIAEEETIDIRQISWFKSIPMRLKAQGDELKIYDSGEVPFINVANAQNEQKRLLDADEVVLNHQKVTLIIDYPILKPIHCVLEGTEKGFTRSELIKHIAQNYYKLYQEIAQENGNKPLSERKYGVKNIDVLALNLASIEVYMMPSGKKLLTLHWDN